MQHGETAPVLREPEERSTAMLVKPERQTLRAETLPIPDPGWGNDLLGYR
jgi:hypothetical protein